MAFTIQYSCHSFFFFMMFFYAYMLSQHSATWCYHQLNCIELRVYCRGHLVSSLVYPWTRGTFPVGRSALELTTESCDRFEASNGIIQSQTIVLREVERFNEEGDLYTAVIPIYTGKYQ